MKNIILEDKQIKELIDACNKYANKEYDEKNFIDRISQICGEISGNEPVKLRGGHTLKDKMVIRLANQIFNEALDYNNLETEPLNYIINDKLKKIKRDWILFAVILVGYIIDWMFYGFYGNHILYVIQEILFISEAVMIGIQLKNGLVYYEMFKESNQGE